jgi:hypothetical protein
MRSLVFITVLVVFVSCKTQPDLDELITDMVVVTQYDTTANFGSYDTYMLILDTVGLITNGDPGYAVTPYTKKLTSTIKQSLDGTGRIRVAADQSPHLYVNIYVVNETQTFQSVYYPGYGYGGFSGYPGYYNYPQVSYYQSQSAILVIEFQDLLNLPPGGEPNIVWTANIGDLINSIDQDTKTVEAILQAFTQSAYLNQ